MSELTWRGAWKRMVRGISRAIIGHLGMDVVIHSYPIFSVLWWSRTCLLAAVLIVHDEALYVLRWANSKNGNGTHGEDF